MRHSRVGGVRGFPGVPGLRGVRGCLGVPGFAGTPGVRGFLGAAGRALGRGLPLLLLSPIGAPAAGAQEQAGTQSVLAAGAGNRALGMGAAFVAAADDASALIWNPAGLGWVGRLEVQASQSSDLGLGFREGYVAAAFPSWRWGTVGVSFRYFGTGGIEHRDARNVLLGELSDTETETAIGYGRRLGEAWGVGGSLKFRRHAIGAESGSGVGMDFGLTAVPALALGLREPWAAEWSWGLSARNAIEPSLRLDRESVPDPMTISTGLAWRRAASPLGGVLVEMDLERARGVGPRLKAGLEWRLHPILALRSGLHDGRLTAGSGVRWGSADLDYVYEDNPVASSHRLGVTLPFGRTVEEKREAALRAEDEALQRRLAEGFRRRIAEQVAGLLARAESARAEGRFDEALETLARIATLEPGHAAALALEATCLRGKATHLERAGDFLGAAMTYDLALAAAPGDSVAAAGKARCLEEGDRRAARSEVLRGRFQQAMDRFAAEDLAAAREAFTAVLAEEPADLDARAMLERTRQAIASRVARMVQQARRYAGLGLPEEAARSLDEARRLDPDAPGIADAAAALARARRPAETQASGPTRPATEPGRAATATSAMPERELESLYRKGLESMNAQRPEEALRYWDLVWAARPDYRGVGKLLQREHLARGMAMFAAGRLEEAVEHWEKALRVDPSDPRARGYLERAQKQLARSREILGGER